MSHGRGPKRRLDLGVVLLVGVAGMACVVGSPWPWHVDRWDDISVAEVQMETLATAVRLHRRDRGRLPSELHLLLERHPRTGEPYIDRVRTDPWGRAYELRLEGNDDFAIVSHGPDAIRGTCDDLRWPRATGAP